MSKGIAIMLVLSAIMILSMIALEFVYGTNINYRLALNEKERLQAFYLAESSLNLMKLEIALDKQARAVIAGSPLSQYVSLGGSAPLCQQLPLSTSVIKAFFIGGQIPGEEGEEAGETEEPAGAPTIFETERATEFLSFDGDFDGSCEDETSKLNLNFFSTMDPMQKTLAAGPNQYDAHKIVLANFLKNERFNKLFEGVPPEKIEEIVRNVADWVDKDSQINDMGGLTRGEEEGIYKDPPQVKNAKFLSLDEVYLVEGVEDDWFEPIEGMFTVYGGNRVNVCQAADEVLWALIFSYAGQRGDVPPIDPRNEEMREKLIGTVRMSCEASSPQASQIGADLDQALGVAPGQPAGAGFANMITTEPQFYSLKLTGQVGNTVVNIKTVLDTRDPSPRRWKTVYYKIY